MKRRQVLVKWRKELEKDYAGLHHRVIENREAARADVRLTIWLGGPGKHHHLYRRRQLIREFLESENFEVVFSEQYLGGADLVSREEEEVEALDVVLILALTPGASAEAIDFANLTHINRKLWVYIPREYRDGYVYKSLSGKHRVATEHNLFSLRKFNSYGPEVAVKLMNRVIDQRMKIWRKRNQTAN